MKRTVLVFGVISGLISAVMMFITMPLVHRGDFDMDHAEVIGYTSMFLAFLLVFFGIRSYREQHGGTITFGRGFAIGLLITLLSSAFYVASWEVIYYTMMPNFPDTYAAAVMKKMHARGASEAEIAKTREQMKMIKKLYSNPFTIAAITLIEPLPVGLIMTLASAGILRRREPRQGGSAVATLA